MIQFSTPDFKFLFVDNPPEGISGLSNEEEAFYHSIQPRLDQEIKEPHITTVNAILAYSKSKSSSV